MTMIFALLIFLKIWYGRHYDSKIKILIMNMLSVLYRKYVFVGILMLFTLLPTATMAFSGTDMIRFTGATTNDNAGIMVTASGDLDADGYSDIAISASDTTNAGSVYILYGKSSSFSALILPASPTIELTGDSANDSVSTLAFGDINNDGYDDLLVGATKDDGTVGSDIGTIFLVYGSATRLTSGLLSARGAKFTGETDANESVGSAVASGDVNGDGYDDIIFGASTNNDNGAQSGAVFLIYGQSTAFISSTLSSATRVQFSGKSSFDKAGGRVATGDINSDGFDDLLIDAMMNSDGANKAGAIFIVYGQSATLSGGILSSSNSVEITGEAANDNLSYPSTGDINGDGYDDIVMGSVRNSDGAQNAGAVYIIYGQSATLSTSSVSTAVEFTGKAVADAFGVNVVADINNDGYEDILMSASFNDDAGSGAGAMYLVYGKAAAFTGITSVTDSTVIAINGSTAGEAFGTSIGFGDVNGDGYKDLLVGAPTYNPSSATNTGAAYLGYLGIDADKDGTLASSGGLLLTGTDCSDTDATVAVNQTYYADADADTYGNSASTTAVCASTAPTGYVTNSTDCSDTDATVSVNQTYYADADGDGLGDPLVTSVICSSTAPDGYIDNDNDTIDTILNNGEVNTGTNPYYSSLDPTDVEAVATNILSISAEGSGKIRVTYADNSVFEYTAITSTSTKDVRIAQYNETAYIVALLPNGKKIALVNAYNGDVVKTVTLSKKRAYSKTSLKILDVRNDNTDDVVVTLKKNSTIGLFVLTVNTTTPNILKKGSLIFSDKNVAPAKTAVQKKTILLKSSKGKIVHRINVSKKYTLGILNS